MSHPMGYHTSKHDDDVADDDDSIVTTSATTVNIEHDVDTATQEEEEADSVVYSSSGQNNDMKTTASTTITALTSSTTTLEVVHLLPNQHLYLENNHICTHDYPTYSRNNNCNNNNFEVDDNVEPITICIGYIFASKKMNTMSVVMAEASKVRLGLLCTAATDAVRNISRGDPSFILSSDERGDNDGISIKPENHHEDTPSMDNVLDNYSNQFTLTQARLLTHEGVSSRNYWDSFQQQPMKHTTNKNNMYSGTSKAKKSLYNGSSTSTPSSSSSSQQNQQPSLSPSSQSTDTTTNFNRSYSYQTKSYNYPATTTNAATNQTSDLAKDINTCSTKDPPLVTSSEIFDTETYTANQIMKNVVVPLRISFVPLDDSIPFKEQHSGKIDIILHKLTEDILHASKQMMQQQQMTTKPLQGCDTNDYSDHRQHDSPLPLYFNASSGDLRQQELSMERLQRLLDYNQEQEQLSKNYGGTHVSTSIPYDPMGCLIDHPMAVRKVMCRAEIADTLQRCLQNVQTKSGIPVRTPKHAILRQNERLISTNNIQQNGVKSQVQHLLRRLSFPIIVKPLVAAGTKSSHAMTIIMENGDSYRPYDRVRCTSTATLTVPDDTCNDTTIEASDQSSIDNLQELSSMLSDKYPCLCQEYSNHDAKLYKVYVLGDHVSVHQRRSLPNLPTTRSASISTVTNSNGGISNLLQQKPNPSKYTSVEFDSQRPYPHLADFGYTSTDEDDPDNGNDNDNKIDVQVTVDEVRPVVRALKQAFHLELFGFDILVTNVAKSTPTSTCVSNTVAGAANRHTANKMMLVVDVNYFPSYKELTNFPNLLAQYLAQRAIIRRRQQQQHSHTQQNYR